MTTPDSPPVVLDANILLSFAQDTNAFFRLREYLGSRARWVDVVRRELEAEARSDRPIANAPTAFRDAVKWLGDPIRLDDPDLLAEIAEIRERLGGTDDSPLQHLGEAASIVACRARGFALGTDDRGAKEIGYSEGIGFITTPRFLMRLVEVGALTCDQAFDAYEKMLRVGRRLPHLSQRELCSGSFPD